MVKVNINIAGRKYPMNVNPEEEEYLRNAGKRIEKMIRAFEQQYEIRDKQDALAMIALQMTAENIHHKKQGNLYTEETSEKIKSLVNKLKNAI